VQSHKHSFLNPRVYMMNTKSSLEQVRALTIDVRSRKKAEKALKVPSGADPSSAMANDVCL